MTTTQRTALAVGASLLLLLVGCQGNEPPDDGGSHAAAAHLDQASHAQTPGIASDHSVYLLPSFWTDQRGDEMALDALGGRVQVVAMVYTHCTYSCPGLMAMMKKIEGDALEVGAENEVGFTLISLDPERDTPERLAEFAAQTRLDPGRWTLLTGSEDDVRALSVLLGVKYRKAEDGRIDHTNLVTVLDAEGVPVTRLEGLGADTGPAFRVIRDLLPGTSVQDRPL